MLEIFAFEILVLHQLDPVSGKYILDLSRRRHALFNPKCRNTAVNRRAR